MDFEFSRHTALVTGASRGIGRAIARGLALQGVKVAAALDTSLPSMVRTLAALEKHLGIRLLSRTTRRIHLTDEGAQYLERCRIILSEVQETEAELASRRIEPQGSLTPGAQPQPNAEDRT